MFGFQCDVMKSGAVGRNPYLVKAVVHSCQVLVAFRSPLKTLTLHEIVARSGLSKTMVFRLLYTLEKCGMVEKREQKLYRATVHPVKGSVNRSFLRSSDPAIRPTDSVPRQA